MKELIRRACMRNMKFPCICGSIVTVIVHFCHKLTETLDGQVKIRWHGVIDFGDIKAICPQLPVIGVI